MAKTTSTSDRQNILSFLEGSTAMLQRHLQQPDREQFRYSVKSVLPQDWNCIAIAHWLLGDINAARAGATEMVRSTIDYFHGDWRDVTPWGEQKRDRAYWRRTTAWRDHFIFSLAWALWLDDADAVARLASYPDEECPADTEQDRAALYLATCGVLLRRDQSIIDGYTNVAYRTRSVRMRKLAELLSAVRERDSASAAELLRELVSAHNRRRSTWTEEIDFECSVLVHLSRRADVTIDVGGTNSLLLLGPSAPKPL